VPGVLRLQDVLLCILAVIPATPKPGPGMLLKAARAILPQPAAARPPSLPIRALGNAVARTSAGAVKPVGAAIVGVAHADEDSPL
jgi:hypothetical protein